MVPFILVPLHIRSAILILFFLLFIFQVYGYITSCSSGKMNRNSIGIIIMAVVSLILLSFLTKVQTDVIFDEELWTVTQRVSNIPALIVTGYMILSGIFSVVAIKNEVELQSKKITRESIRESVNNLPLAVCFARLNGQPYLVNHKMEELTHSLTGRGLQNEDVFWSEVHEGKLTSESECINVEESQVTLRHNNKTWVFKRGIIQLQGERIIQLTASDCTELYEMKNRLEKYNRELHDRNLRLKQYSEKVDELTRTEERLATKIRIHDSIGQNLMVTIHAITTDASQEHLNGILARWQRTIYGLKNEVELEEQIGALKYLIDVAKFIGVKLDIKGEFPQEGKVSELLVVAGAEILTNAVQHGNAKTLIIDIKEYGDRYNIDYINDGETAEGDIIEGGGLASLRYRIEAIGGTVSVSSEPDFTVHVMIPIEGSYENDQSYDC